VPAALLETKLYVPRSRRGLVPRLRLSERLDRGAASKLMLVSAPAGFGKTTLLTEWLAAGPAAPADGRLAAWLSLDRTDNDPVSFWTYVIAALRTVASGVGERALTLLHAPQPPPIETALTTLLNDLGSVSGDIVLVLDDYHVIDARDVQDGMEFLLDHLPPGLHVVIASRADPALPLPRLRARGELVEIRAAELRFTPDEAAAYLNGMMGLQLTAADVAALEGRTEGWIAALQLAALSMQGRDDAAGFIAGFAGDDRYVVDYLVEEVLQRQSDRVRAFLLQTSVLGRLSGPLCDAVTGHGSGKGTLEALDRGNLFLVPLDDRRQWYRYHHLFADVLRARLLDEQPDQAPGLHWRASVWYEQNGEPSMAIGHALAAEDFGRAADLVELAIPAMRRGRQEATVRGWLEVIPDELVRVRPVLAVGFAGALLAASEFEGVQDRLRDAERWLEPEAGDRPGGQAHSAEMVVVDKEEFPRLPGTIELYRAGLALAQGDAAGTVRHARQAMDRALEEDHLCRAGAAGLLGLTFWGSGDLVAAHRDYSACVAGLRRAGLTSTSSSSSSMIRTPPAPSWSVSCRRQAGTTASRSCSADISSRCDGGRSPDIGRRSSQRSGPAEPSEITARSAPARNRLPRIRLPGRRLAAACGIRIATRPPGRVCVRQCCTHASSDSPRGGRPYAQRGSSVSSAWPQDRSLNGGSHTTASASSSENPSCRRESPATTVLTRSPASRSRAAVISALLSVNSWPSNRGAWDASSSEPRPQAGSSTVSASSARSARISTISGGVTPSWRECAAT